MRDQQLKTAAKADTTPAAAASATKTADTDSGGSFWNDVLDVVNPLQHLPVVGTVYRAVTGDKIGDVEKVAGDTLYGGPIGLASSLADLAFEKLTGKNFGDTVMSFVGLEHDDSTTALAANTPKAGPAKTAVATKAPVATAAPTQLASTMKPRIVPATPPMMVAQAKPAPASAAPAPAGTSSVMDISSNTDALLQALARNGVTGDMQTQALDAYKRTMNLNTPPLTPAVN